MMEWGLYWEAVWPKSRAELWVAEDAEDRPLAAVPLVRRKRWGVDMCCSQPYGTPCGPLGVSVSPEEIDALLSAIAGSRTVELAVSPDWWGDRLTGWRGQSHQRQSWVLELPVGADLMTQISDSHRRNIARGEACAPAIAEPSSAAEVGVMIDAWQAPPQGSRLMLNRDRALIFHETFASTGAVLWKMAAVGSRPVAGYVFLHLGEQAVYVDGATVRGEDLQGIGHLLFAAMLEDLRRAGVRHVDLGSGPRGASDPGLEQFKRGWGARPEVRTEGIYRRPWYARLRRALGR